jgi:hypothetical protein
MLLDGHDIGTKLQNSIEEKQWGKTVLSDVGSDVPFCLYF